MCLALVALKPAIASKFATVSRNLEKPMQQKRGSQHWYITAFSPLAAKGIHDWVALEWRKARKFGDKNLNA